MEGKTKWLTCPCHKALNAPRLETESDSRTNARPAECDVAIVRQLVIRRAWSHLHGVSQMREMCSCCGPRMIHSSIVKHPKLPTYVSARSSSGILTCRGGVVNHGSPLHRSVGRRSSRNKLRMLVSRRTNPTDAGVLRAYCCV